MVKICLIPNELYILLGEVAKYDKVRGRYSELKDKLERASARLEALKESFKDGPLQQLSEEIKVLEKVPFFRPLCLSVCDSHSSPSSA